MRRHILAVACVALVVLGVRIVLRDYYAREYREVVKKASVDRAAEMMASWQALPYLKATETNLADVLLSKIDWNSLALTELQSTTLKTRLREVISYLQAPTLDEYYRLKSEGLHFVFEPTRPDRIELSVFAGWITNEWTTNYPASNQTASDVLAWVWNKYYGTNVAPHITALSPDHIAVSLSATNSVSSLVKGKTGKLFTVLLSAMDPGFQYDNALAAETNAGSGVKDTIFLNASFYVQASPSGASGPMFVTLGWSPSDRKWVLQRLLADNFLALRTFF